MIVTVDSSALALIINPYGTPPQDPKTGEPVEDAAARIELFLKSLGTDDTIIIPSPVLAEILVGAQDGGPEMLSKLTKSPRIKTKAFGTRAAVETAAMTRAAIGNGDKFGGSVAPWQRVKFDRQIVAIARVEKGSKIYADDANLVRFARRLGMEVFSTWELPAPEKPHPDLFNMFDK